MARLEALVGSSRLCVSYGDGDGVGCEDVDDDGVGCMWFVGGDCGGCD